MELIFIHQQNCQMLKYAQAESQDYQVTEESPSLNYSTNISKVVILKMRTGQSYIQNLATITKESPAH